MIARPPRLRASLAVVLGLFAVLMLPGLALAHTELVTSEPAAGSTVPAGLNRIILAFTEPAAAGSAITLYTGVFEPVPGVNSYVANGQLWADLNPALAAGTYTVQWSAVSDDGHTVEGSLQFAVADAPAAFPWAELLCVGAILVAVGGLLFILAPFVRARGGL